MTDHPHDPDEDLITAALCAYQARLDLDAKTVDGRGANTPEATTESNCVDVPDGLKSVLDGFQRCLDLLHEDRLQNRRAAESVATDHRVIEKPSQALTLDQTPDHARRTALANTSQSGEPGIVGVAGGYSLPSQIGRFQIIEQLGVGGFGIVFRGFDPVVSRAVAIKIPRPELLASPDLVERFAREAAAAAQLEHPNIVQVYEGGCHGTVPYLVMPLIPGKTLARWRFETADVPVRMAVEIVRQLALGVAHAHSRGVLHRDLKPDNVLLAPLERPPEKYEPPFTPKLTDFGLAKCADQAYPETRTGIILGTPCYMSPEQAEGRSREITARSDVYGLGAILFELVSGTRPFTGENEMQTIQKIQHEEPSALLVRGQRVAKDLEVICLKCLEKQSANRYASADMLADDLQRFLKGEPIWARPISPAGRLVKWCRRHPVRGMGLAAAVVGTFSLVGLSLWYNARLTEQLKITERGRQIAREHELRARRRAYVSDMRNAKSSWDQVNVAQTLKLLDRYESEGGEPDFRDFAWWYLWHEYHDSSRVLGIHDDRATAVAMTRDGTVAASGGSDSIIRLWSLPSGKMLAELRGHESGVIESLDFSPSGKRLVSAGSDGTVRVWDVLNVKQLFVNREHDSLVSQAIYSPSGDTIASGGGDNLVRLWDAETGASLQVFSGHSDRVRCLAFHPSKSLLVSGGLDFTLRFWNLDEFGPDSRLKDGLILSELDKWPRTLAFAPDGASLICTTIRERLLQFSLAEATFGQELYREHVGVNVRSLACCRNGVVILGMASSEIRSIDHLEVNARRDRLIGHQKDVMSIAVARDGTDLVSASADGTIRYWPSFQTRSRIDYPTARDTVWTDNHPFYCLQWRGEHLAADFHQSELAIFQMPGHRLVRTFCKSNDDDFALAPDGRLLLICRSDGLVTCHRVADGQALWTRQLPAQDFQLRYGDRTEHCDIDSSGTYGLVVRHPDLYVISLRTAEIVHQFRHPSQVYQVRCFPRSGKSQVALTTCEDGYIRLWDFDGGVLMAEHRADAGPIHHVSLSDDTQFLATTGSEINFRLWRWNDFSQVGTIPKQGTERCQFLAGERILLRDTGTSKRSLWNIEAESELMEISEQGPYGLAISPDGQQIAIPMRGWIRLIDGSPKK